MQQALAGRLWLAGNFKKNAGKIPAGLASEEFMETTAIECGVSQPWLTLFNRRANSAIARAYDRMLKVARAIADLADSEKSSPTTSARQFRIARWTANCGDKYLAGP